MSRRAVVLVMLGLSTGCQCGLLKLNHVNDPCMIDPNICDAGLPMEMDPPDAAVPFDAGLPPCGNEGNVTGRICATDQQTWVNGAAVKVDALDCHGATVHLETSSTADGTFNLTNVPPGDWVIHAELGAFTQETPVTVHARGPTAIPENQLCVAQKTTRIAVVSGSGDQIENLLDALHLQYTLYGGDSSTWTTGAAPFLTSLTELKKYDLIFVDCAAAKANGSNIDLGSQAATIESNLRAYVQQGGSVYASDWALLFTLAASPSSFHYQTQSGRPVSNPLDAKELMGYAPQTVNATVPNQALAQFLGKNTVNIAFPKQSGANSSHWGLMSSTPGAEILVEASGVKTCADTACTNPGATKQNVPLAVRVRVLPAGQKGGNVVYTSFHNIAQTGNDVAQVLKYLVLNL